MRGTLSFFVFLVQSRLISMINKSFVFILVLFFSMPTFCAEKSPTQVTSEFYKWAILHDGGGLPKESDLKPLRKVLSADLVFLLHASLAAEERCFVLTPSDQKPLTFEGSLFVGLYEGLTKVIALREKKVEGKKRIVVAHLGYDNPRVANDVHDWEDTVTLIRENGRWVIDDFASVNDERTLVKALKRYVSKKECGI